MTRISHRIINLKGIWGHILHRTRSHTNVANVGRFLHCDKAFCNGCSFKSHLRAHTGEKPYQCIQCNKVLSQNSHLKSHLRTHNGQKLYQHSYCDKAFSKNSNLKEHLRTHTGEKPYQCSHCDKAFLLNSMYCGFAFEGNCIR